MVVFLNKKVKYMFMKIRGVILVEKFFYDICMKMNEILILFINFIDLLI